MRKDSSSNPVKQRIYNDAFKEVGRDDVVLWDIFPLEGAQRLMVLFERAKPGRRQGVRISSDTSIGIGGVESNAMELWFDSAPAEIFADCSGPSLGIYNIWEDQSGRRWSQGWASGMLVEDIPEGRIYRCNDVGLKLDFDAVVFRIIRLR